MTTAGLLVAALAFSVRLPAAQGSPLLMVPEGARSSALGGAYSMETGTAETLWYNPAGVAAMDATEIGFSHAAWIGDSSLEYLAAAWGGQNLGLGAFAQYASAQDLARDSSGQALGSISLQNVNLGLAAAGQLGFLRIGLAGKLLEQGVDGRQAQGFAGDLGLQSVLWDGRLRLAAAAQNMGGESDPGNGTVQTPMIVRAGVGLGLPQGFNVLAEYRRYIALGQDSFAGGLEYAVRLSGVRSAWRFGWESDLGQGDPAGLTAGVGFGLSDYSLDYAYQSLGDLGMVQRLSLSWHLGGPGPGPKPDPAQMARLAREAYETGRYAESARIYTELADTPDRLNSSNMWSSAAMAWYKLGKRDQALACFRNAYALNPKRAVLEQWIHTLERR